MKKEDYLKSEQVNEFCIWLSKNLKSENLSHSYFDRRAKQQLSFNSILDAYTKYLWNNNNFVENHKVLTTIQKNLRDAVERGDDNDACSSAQEVLKWGGVVNHNSKWLETNKKGLAVYLSTNGSILASLEYNNNNLKSISRFNSGMSKVYSLLINDFIIYDSRVAAALGWMVVKFCTEKKISKVPNGLMFPWSPGQGGSLRNPTVGTLCFPGMHNNRFKYAQWNIHSSWLLSEVIKINKSSDIGCFSDVGNPLRALESALFMIGYDLCPLTN